MTTALVKADVKGVALQVQEIQHLMKDVMQIGEHYGTIPGCGDKRTLLKSGAEKLCLLFHLAPEYKIEKSELQEGHREYQVVCRLVNRSTEEFLGEGVGVCSTMEKKYRYRSAKRVCPSCGEAKIIKGKKDYGGGWVCWSKDKSGCGAKYDDNAPEIIDQKEGDNENPDIADTFNTVLKIGKKRALVDATLTATAASDIFTQDLEDNVAVVEVVEAEIMEAEVVEVAKKETVTLNPIESKRLTNLILDLIKWYKDEAFLETLSIQKQESFLKVLSDSKGNSIVDNSTIPIEKLPSLLNIPSVKNWHEKIGELYDTYDLTKETTNGK